jgi:hypothetical protein
VLGAAYAAAGLDRDPRDSWIRRARLAGLVPWVTVRTAHDTSWQDEQPEVGHGTTFEVRATWRLDRLLFDAKELQVAAIEAARHRERRRLAARVIRAYFAWRRAASAAGAAGVGGDAGEAEAEAEAGEDRAASNEDRVATRLAETIAELDALTDGWFSAQQARNKSRAAPAP